MDLTTNETIILYVKDKLKKKKMKIKTLSVVNVAKKPNGIEGDHV